MALQKATIYKAIIDTTNIDRVTAMSIAQLAVEVQKNPKFYTAPTTKAEVIPFVHQAMVVSTQKPAVVKVLRALLDRISLCEQCQAPLIGNEERGYACNKCLSKPKRKKSPKAEMTKCRTCGNEEPYSGDWYDGECPPCADKSAEKSDLIDAITGVDDYGMAMENFLAQDERERSIVVSDEQTLGYLRRASSGPGDLSRKVRALLPHSLALYGKLSARECATVLAALRYWQDHLENHPSIDGAIPSSYDMFTDETPMTSEEIETLCMRINLGGSKPDPND